MFSRVLAQGFRGGARGFQGQSVLRVELRVSGLGFRV